VLQVEIRVRVVEVTKTNRDQWGINVAVEEVNPKNPNTLFNQATAAYTSAEYLKSLSPAGKQAGPLAFQGARFLLDTVQHDLQLDVAIELLKQYQEVEVLSAPSVRVLNGHPAYIETGERTPILTASYNAAGIVSVATTFQNTGVKLSVIPTVVAEDTIRLNVLPEVSSVTGFTDPATSGGFSVPFISTRKAETVVNVRDGEIFLLGGLYYTTELMQESKFPILGDIPILGYLFSSTNKTFQTSEILFFLQPKVIVPRSGGRGRLVLPPDELK
jgi:type II secretory pathway component GspD/PulD (secretin)